MRKILAVMACVVAVLACCACSGGSHTEEFNGMVLEIPDGWKMEDTGSTETVLESHFWHPDTGSNEGSNIKNGGVIAYKVSYDVFKNLDVGLSDYTYDEKVKEVNDKTIAAIKSTDARVMAAHTFGLFVASAADTEYQLVEKDGRAAWTHEGSGDVGKGFDCAVPFDDYMIILLAVSPESGSDELYRGIIEGSTCNVESNALILEMSRDMEGKAQTEVLNELTSAIGSLRVPVSSSTSADSAKSSSTSSKSSSYERSYSSSKSSSSSEGDLELLYEFDTSDGKGYQGNDGNYYFKNDDGSIEATDGWGNGVRDDDGDGVGDRYTTDGGETWHRY